MKFILFTFSVINIFLSSAFKIWEIILSQIFLLKFGSPRLLNAKKLKCDFFRVGGSITNVYSQTCANDHLQIVTTSVHNDHYDEVPFSILKAQSFLCTKTNCQQQPLFLGPEDGRCTEV